MIMVPAAPPRGAAMEMISIGSVDLSGLTPTTKRSNPMITEAF